MGVTRLIIFQEAKVMPTPINFEEFHYKMLRSVIFVIYMFLYFLYEVILHYKRKKEKEKKML